MRWPCEPPDQAQMKKFCEDYFSGIGALDDFRVQQICDTLLAKKGMPTVNRVHEIFPGLDGRFSAGYASTPQDRELAKWQNEVDAEIQLLKKNMRQAHTPRPPLRPQTPHTTTDEDTDLEPHVEGYHTPYDDG